MKILIASDGSPSSEPLIHEAASRPWPTGTEFTVVTVVDPFFFTRAPLLLEEAKQKTTQSLAEQAKPLADAGWPVNADVILDSPRHALPRIASALSADLILLGSHGRGTVGRLLLGSTAQAVLRHAECSVEVVRRPRAERKISEGMRVMVPTDGSEHAEFALQIISQLPWPAHSEFRIVASPEYPVLIGEYPYYAPEQLAELTRGSRDHAAQSAATGEQRLTRMGFKISQEVIEPMDSPAHAILAAAELWHPDLIVMGSHGRRGFDRLVLGSVSETVALYAPCSVEVVRRPLAVL
jgi:nucleotide-binding universal stress UspA family protein